MNCTPKTCPFCQRPLESGSGVSRCPCRSSSKRKLYRNRKNRKLAGVCGGLAIHLGLPVVFVRLAFVITTLMGGWGILFYLVLCLAPAKQEEVVMVEEEEKYVNPPLPPLSPPPSSPTLLVKFSKFLLFLVLSVCLYLPLMMLLTMSVLIVVWGIGIPIFHIDVFSFSLSQLGTPGLVLGIAATALLLETICLLVHFVVQWHFSRSFLKGETILYMAMFLCLTVVCVSSIAMIFFQHHCVQSRTWSKEIPLTQRLSLADLTRGWRDSPAIRGVFLYNTSDLREVAQISYTVTARGDSSKRVAELLSSCHLVWEGSSALMHFDRQLPPLCELKIEVRVPREIGEISLVGPSPGPLAVFGTWKKIHISSVRERITLDCDCEDLQVAIEGEGLHLQKCRGKNLRIINKNGNIDASLVEFSTIAIEEHRGRSRWRDCQAQQWNIANHGGDISLEQCSGAMHIVDQYGVVRIETPRFPLHSKSSISTDNGEISLFFERQHLPKIEISRGQGQVYDDLTFRAPTIPAQLHIAIGHGKLRLRRR